MNDDGTITVKEVNGEENILSVKQIATLYAVGLEQARDAVNIITARGGPRGIQGRTPKQIKELMAVARRGMVDIFGGVEAPDQDKIKFANSLINEMAAIRRDISGDEFVRIFQVNADKLKNKEESDAMADDKAFALIEEGNEIHRASQYLYETAVRRDMNDPGIDARDEQIMRVYNNNLLRALKYNWSTKEHGKLISDIIEDPLNAIKIMKDYDETKVFDVKTKKWKRTHWNGWSAKVLDYMGEEIPPIELSNVMDVAAKQVRELRKSIVGMKKTLPSMPKGAATRALTSIAELENILAKKNNQKAIQKFIEETGMSMSDVKIIIAAETEAEITIEGTPPTKFPGSVRWQVSLSARELFK